MSETILILNAGSSSIKFQLFATQGGAGLERRLKGEIEGIGTNPHLTAETKDGRRKSSAMPPPLSIMSWTG
jgi:acetate kinase